METTGDEYCNIKIYHDSPFSNKGKKYIDRNTWIDEDGTYNHYEPEEEKVKDNGRTASEIIKSMYPNGCIIRGGYMAPITDYFYLNGMRIPC